MRGLSHRRFRRVINRYADGELDAVTAQALAVHLLQCDSCSRELAMARAIRGSLRRLADAEPPTLAAARLQRWASNPLRIRQAPSLEPQGRVCDAVGSTSDPPGGVGRLVGQTGRHRRCTGAGALLAVVTALAATGALLLLRQRPSPDPGAVTALVELARLEPPAPP